MRDAAGNRIPYGGVGFSNLSDFYRMRDGVRAGNRQNFAPNPQTIRAVNGSTGTNCHVQITGGYNSSADAWPAVYVVRNLNPVSSGDPKWIVGEACMAFDINDHDLVVGQRYAGHTYEDKIWNPGSGPNLSRFVAVGDIDRSSDGGPCGNCGWLLHFNQHNCVKIRMRGGNGACDCVQDESFELSGTGIYNSTAGGWVATNMKKTCCGCGMVIFSITDAEKGEGQLELHSFHTSCVTDGSGGEQLFTRIIKSLKCCLSEDTGKPMMVFSDYSADACNDDPGECGDYYNITVECMTCPKPICGCCCSDEAAVGWFIKDIIGFTDQKLNGSWVWEYDTVAGGCNWNAECYGTRSAITYDSDGGVYRLTHGTSIYERTAAGWACCCSNTFTKISGDGPGTLIVTGLKPSPLPLDHVDDNRCKPPDSLTMSVSSAACPLLNSTKTVTRATPGTGPWTSPLDVGGINMTLACDAEGHVGWFATVTGQCVAPSGPVIAFGAATSGPPNIQSFGPLYLKWTGVAITGTPDIDGCCHAGSDAIIVVTE